MTWTLARKFDRLATTERGLIRKINRRLPEYHKLHKSRQHEQGNLGDYYVVDHAHNAVTDHHIADLRRYCADLDIVV
jgi:hypothetical protein